MAKLQSIKVIIIDSENRQVSEKVIPNELSELQKIVGGLIETACYPKDNTVVYVDEEGLFKGHVTGFKFDGVEHVPYFVGNAVVVSLDDEGGNVDCNISVDEIRSSVSFVQLLGKVLN